MERKYNIRMPEYTFDQAKVDAEVKKIIDFSGENIWR